MINTRFFFGCFMCLELESLQILAANTQLLKDMVFMFNGVMSYLEQDITNKPTTSGLSGLEKLNVEGVSSLNRAFMGSICKQETLNQLAGWRFSADKVDILHSFSSISKDLDFKVLDNWKYKIGGGDVSFYAACELKDIFLDRQEPNKDKRPSWYEKINIREC